VLALVVFILVLSRSMKEAGALEDLVDSVRNVFLDNRFTIAALPAMIGLMPVPGGALISAPMIEDLSDEAKLSPEDRTYLNYWYRHVWEYSYPLYPGLILASAIVEVELSTLTVYQFPLSLAAILGGAIFGLLGIEKHFRKRLNGHNLTEQIAKFFRGFWPVLLILFSLLAAPVVSKYINYEIQFLHVLVIVVPLFGISRLGLKKFLRVAYESLNIRLIGTIYAVLVFKDIIKVSGAVEELSTVFTEWSVPPILLFMVLPALIGYLNGITHAYVSVAFPLLLPFFGDPANLPEYLSRVQLAYSFGFIGVIFSPVHLCLVLSTKYFNADINGVFKRLIMPSVVLATVSLAIYFLT